MDKMPGEIVSMAQFLAILNERSFHFYDSIVDVQVHEGPARDTVWVDWANQSTSMVMTSIMPQRFYQEALGEGYVATRLHGTRETLVLTQEGLNHLRQLMRRLPLRSETPRPAA